MTTWAHGSVMVVAECGSLLTRMEMLNFVKIRKSGKEVKNCYRIIRKYYNHKGSPDFNQMTVFVEGMLPLCVKPCTG